jgi:hypothetical protein
VIEDTAAVESLYDHGMHSVVAAEQQASEAQAAMQKQIAAAKEAAMSSDGGCAAETGLACKIAPAAPFTGSKTGSAQPPAMPEGRIRGEAGHALKRLPRVQEHALGAMVDAGLCMSMHQPYASLLVRGIKQHEGRTWYSAHRGRLWIAAGAKEVTPTEIDALEAFYRDHHGSDELVFPDAYPTGCLLGCVHVDDVLPQAEYRQRFPDGESESPFVFICSQPNELLVRFPMQVCTRGLWVGGWIFLGRVPSFFWGVLQGNHKIFKLPKAVHDGAKEGIVSAEPGPVRKTAMV